jgi:mRNA-degrading endonuclease RelE of RelBE toxin-antitoxin system
LTQGPHWLVNTTDEAERGLEHLRRRKRPVWQEAVRLMRSLEHDPFIGDSLSPPFDPESRRIHFGRDKYRLVWRVESTEGIVDVVAVGRKDPTFYERALEALETIWERIAASTEQREQRQRRRSRRGLE